MSDPFAEYLADEHNAGLDGDGLEPSGYTPTPEHIEAVRLALGTHSTHYLMSNPAAILTAVGPLIYAQGKRDALTEAADMVATESIPGIVGTAYVVDWLRARAEQVTDRYHGCGGRVYRRIFNGPYCVKCQKVVDE